MPTKKTTTKKPAAKKAAITKATKTTTKRASTKSKAATKATKKPAGKAAASTKAKKTTATKATKNAKRDLVYADNERSFWVQNGEILNSLVALRDALDAMEEEVYRAHANAEKNDFAVWVGEVLCDEECAAAIARAKTPKTAKTAVVRHLKIYSV